jgi:hypothetical protein
MFILNDYLMMHLFKQNERDRLHEAEMYRLTKMCRRKNQSWLTRTTCWLLARLGQLMLKWGERLQSYSLAGEGHKA